MADHPLRPATRLRLGKPLPYQLADGTRTHPLVIAFKKRPPLTTVSEGTGVLCGISVPFETLSPAKGQIIHVLRTRAPLSTHRSELLVRLACVRPAANVRSEPGSNSPIEMDEHPDILTNVILLLVALVVELLIADACASDLRTRYFT